MGPRFDCLSCLQCLDAAKSIIRNMVEILAPSGYMRYAPDGMCNQLMTSTIPSIEFFFFSSLQGHFIFASFASAFLLKVGLGYYLTLVECD